MDLIVIGKQEPRAFAEREEGVVAGLKGVQWHKLPIEGKVSMKI